MRNDAKSYYSPPRGLGVRGKRIEGFFVVYFLVEMVSFIFYLTLIRVLIRLRFTCSDCLHQVEVFKRLHLGS